MNLLENKTSLYLIRSPPQEFDHSKIFNSISYVLLQQISAVRHDT